MSTGLLHAAVMSIVNTSAIRLMSPPVFPQTALTAEAVRDRLQRVEPVSR